MLPLPSPALADEDRPTRLTDPELAALRHRARREAGPFVDPKAHRRSDLLLPTGPTRSDPGEGARTHFLHAPALRAAAVAVQANKSAGSAGSLAALQ